MQSAKVAHVVPGPSQPAVHVEQVSSLYPPLQSVGHSGEPEQTLQLHVRVSTPWVQLYVPAESHIGKLCGF